MRILFLSSYVDPSTGASVLANLAERLKKEGHDIRILTTARGFDSETIKSITLPTVLDILSRIINRILPNYFGLYCFRLLNEVDSYNPDVINIHWTHGTRPIPISIIPVLCEKYPLFWTMHDLWPITANSFFEYADDNILMKDKDSLIKRVFRNVMFSHKWLFRYKVNLLGNLCIHTISPSKWLLKKVDSSPVFESSCNHYAPNGVDTDVFKPRCREKLREKYNIPKHEKVILFLSSNLADKRKGFHYFSNAVMHLKDINPKLIENTTIILVGGSGAGIGKYLPTKVINYPSTGIKEHLVDYYNLADVFVSASLADNFPSTSLESLACGTPVVAFDVGGVGDIIIEHKTGLLSECKNIDSLARNIEKILIENGLSSEISKNCRNYAIEHFRMNKFIDSYMQLFSNE